MGKGFAKKKKQMRTMQEQFGQLQKKMSETEFEGTAGNGLVTIVLNGNSDMTRISIKPECVNPDDIEGLEDLIKEAHKEASAKAQSQLEGGLPAGIPNMSQFTT